MGVGWGGGLGVEKRAWGFDSPNIIASHSSEKKIHPVRFLFKGSFTIIDVSPTLQRLLTLSRYLRSLCLGGLSRECCRNFEADNRITGYFHVADCFVTDRNEVVLYLNHYQSVFDFYVDSTLETYDLLIEVLFIQLITAGFRLKIMSNPTAAS